MADAQHHRMSEADLAFLARQRSRAVALANVTLLLLILPLLSVYGENVSTGSRYLFLGLELGVVVAGLLLASWRETVEDVRSILRDQGRVAARVPSELTSHSDQNAPSEQPLLLFSILFVIVLTNYYAIGWLINATGGITGSPFTQFAFSMTVLGLLMGYERITKLVIAVFGAAFFAALIYTPILGASRTDVVSKVDHLPTVFLIVTVVNLFISLLVNLVGVPPGSQNGGSSGAVQETG